MDDAPEKLLFTPGPLTTSPTVKQAMLRDVGSREEEFVSEVAQVRNELLRLAGTSQEEGFEAVLMQGAGTFGLEAVCASGIPADGQLLVLVNGAYGRRMAEIARTLGIAVWELEWEEDQPVDPAAVNETLEEHAEITHVSLVHCETTTGIMNPLHDVCRVVAQHGRRMVVDAMSSFGCIPVDFSQVPIDYLVSSSNKCLEGVPGFSFVLFRRDALDEVGDFTRSVSLDMGAQWRGLEGNGQFRFTPPTHAILAFGQALRELEAEGGVESRGARYRSNQEAISRGMAELGLMPFLDPSLQGPVITTFRYHEDPAFQFDELYRRLAEKGFIIYPGKLSQADCFRIGSAGQIGMEDVISLLVATRASLEDMGVTIKPV